jgi:hypothetical protein
MFQKMEKQHYRMSIIYYLYKKYLIIIFLCFSLINSSYAYTGAIRKNRFSNDITVGIQSNLYQIKFLDILNNETQKFLESGMRLSVGKYYVNGLKLEASFMKGFNGIGPLFNNSESSQNYLRIYNTKLFLLNGQYDLYVDPNTFVSFNLGFGRLAYSQRYDGALVEKVKENKISDVISIASKFNYSFSRTFVGFVEANYIFGKDELKFPILGIGLNYHITLYNFKKFKRNCPTFF